MTLVTLEDARNRLPELIAKMAAGEQVVIADGEKLVAALTAPPKAPVPSGPSSASNLRAELFRSVIAGHEEQGDPLPADHPLREALLREQQG